MNKIKIVIPGNPIPKARHKRRKLRDGRIMDYDPQHSVKQAVGLALKKAVDKSMGYQNSIRSSVLQQIHLLMGIYCPLPGSASYPLQNIKLWGVQPHIQKPDCSNVLKFYEDAANEILYRDDCMITKIQVHKEYSTNPRVELTLTAIDKTTTADQDEILKIFSPDDIENLIMAFDELPGCKGDVDFWNEMVTNEQKWKTATRFLSILADRFATKFQKVAKKAPGYWQKAGTNHELRNRN